MSGPKNQPDIFEVLVEYMDSTTSPSYESLVEWSQRYPEYRHELMDFAAEWTFVENLPPEPELDQISEKEFVIRSMDVVRGLLQKSSPAQPTSSEAPIASITAEAKRRGMTLQDLAEAAGMSIVLITKFNRRLIRLCTIPDRAIDALAQAMNCPADAIRIYLAQPSTFAQGGAHRADRAPTLAEPEDFFEAVRRDPSLRDDLRAKWLAFAPHESERPR